MPCAPLPWRQVLATGLREEWWGPAQLAREAEWLIRVVQSLTPPAAV